MSTKSMRPPPRRVAWGNNSSSTPSNGNGSSSSSKRKDEERYHDGFKRPTTVPTAPMPKLFKPNKPIAEPKPTQNKSSNPMVCSSSSSKGPIPQINNQLLAGYMAHEFLTKGTLMGRPWGPKPSPGVEPLQQKHERYVEVTTHLLKKDGTHLRGVVNPTQLAHVLRLT